MGRGRELYGRSKGGTLIPVEIGLSQIQTVGGTLVLSSIVDIRERKRADDNLRAALEQLQLITDNLPAAVARVTATCVTCGQAGATWHCQGGGPRKS